MTIQRRSERLTPNGIFGPCAWWSRGLARWESCWRVVVGVSLPNGPKMTPNLRKVLFPEIGHVTDFQKHTQKIIQVPRSLTPRAARPPPVFPECQKLETADFQYFQDRRNYKNLDFQYFQDYRECWRLQFPIFPGQDWFILIHGPYNINFRTESWIVRSIHRST